MVNKLKSKALEKLLEEISNSEEVIEFRKVEKLVLADNYLHEQLDHLTLVEKQAVNARELGLDNAYLMYKKEYDEILESLSNNVLFNQYLSLKKDAKEVMNTVINLIEKEIFYKVNN